ncbi:major facilitator superfamily transporter [Diplogelasinospora grovesii]|uniref:Major facilitator superfamily transporter n=1 Tax=Diplogelasinospora grovesii TaxID=303347 RepID=A0AAN6MVC7_9PEZI|nr:major facilitator superfamily transporter [Diplogelasinospora grovesii]
MAAAQENPQPSKPAVSVPGPEAEQWKPSLHEFAIMAVLSVLSLIVALDACVIVTALSAIVSDLKGNTTQASWVGTAYLLANAVMMPVISSLSDIFGRPVCLFASLSVFALGSLVCCLANSIGVLLIGRSFQGVGGAGIIILSLIIYTDIVPLRFRPKWYGIVLGAWALGNCAGPVIGGAIAQMTTWRWVFYIMFPFCGVGLLLIPWLVTLKPQTATMGEKLMRVDWLGSFSFISSATLFLIAVSWGGIQHQWRSASTLVPMCLGTAGLVWTLTYEAFLAREPFMRLSLFWNSSSVATYICGAIQGLVLYGQLYYVPFYFLAVKGYSPMHTGLVLLPVMVTLVPGSIMTGLLVTRTKNYRYPIWTGWALTGVATGLTLIWDVDTPAAVWVTTLVILGFGHGAILNAQNFAAQAVCKQGEEGLAAAMYGFLRQFGMALGVGVGGSAFQNVMALKLKWEGLPTDIAAQSESFVIDLLKLPDSAFKSRVLDAYVFGFRGVYAVYVGISGLAFLLSLLVKRFDMDKEINTSHMIINRIKGSRLPEA